MPDELKGYRVFIATPGGLEDERQAFHQLLLDYNEQDAHARGCTFIPVRWEITLGGMGRPQDTINKDLAGCDYFVMVLHDRWGWPSGRSQDGVEYSSGTHEEYCVARGLYDDDAQRMRQLVLFFKGVDERQLSDPGEQLQAVLDFKTTIEQERALLYHRYDAVEEFKDHLRRWLAAWVRDHEQGDTAKARPPTGGDPTPPAALDPAPDSPSDPAPSGRSSELIAEGQRLADAGRITEAERCFASAVAAGRDIAAFNEYGRFLLRIGRLTHARAMYERVVESADAEDEPERWRATGYGNLGLIHRMRGELDEAERLHRKALEIDEQLGRREGMAADYGNLGLIHEERGELDEAERLYRKALEIDEQLGRREGMAADYGNLGLIHRMRGELDEAERMLRKALEIFERLGRREGMAADYGNLGLIHEERGELDEAERMLPQGSQYSTRSSGYRSIWPTEYGNLGRAPRRRAVIWTKPNGCYRRALEIDKKLGRLEGMATATTATWG